MLALSLAFWFTVIDLCLIISDSPFQYTQTFFITFQALDLNLYMLLLVEFSKLFGYPSCAVLVTSQTELQ